MLMNLLYGVLQKEAIVYLERFTHRGNFYQHGLKNECFIKLNL